MGTTIKNDRIHYMDHLRALAMILGVFYHSAAGYSTNIQYDWMVRNIPLTDTLTVFRIFSHDFRMPLFYLIAGFFAHLLFEKRGFWLFLKNRSIRVLFPLILFVPIVYYSFYGVFIFAGKYLGHTFFNYIHLSGNSGVHLAHLWFLYYLFGLYLIFLAFRWIKIPFINRVLSAILSSSWSLLLLPLILLPGIYIAPQHLAAPINLTGELWPFLYFGVFFFIGWHIFKRQHFMDIIDLQMNKLVIVASILFVAQVYITFNNHNGQNIIVPKLPLSVLKAYTNFYLVLIALGLGKRFLDKDRQWMRYMSDASYWIYIIHLPLVLMFQVLLAPVSINLWLKFIIVSVVVLIIATITYQCLVRYTPIGWMLNGKRKFVRGIEAGVPASPNFR